MILAALAAVFINTEESLSQGEQEMSQFYTVFKTDSTTRANQSTGLNLAYSIGNSFVIVTFICCVTFFIVLLYKFRFMKCLIGYMIFSSASLLGALGSTVLNVAIEKYRIPIDKFTFYFFIFNFAVVGVIAIFYQRGIPTYITQSYLVATSVILAWQLAHFDAWTSWTLLVFLALYDLCAVLSPCGPLKALVGLMQQDDAPDMPGLLYEASLPAGAERRVRSSNNNRERRNNASENSSTNGNNPNSNNDTTYTTDNSTHVTNQTDSTENVEEHPLSSDSNTTATSTSSPIDISDQTISPDRIITVPLAIAKVYRLPLLSSMVAQTPNTTPITSPINVSTSPLLQENHASELSTVSHTPAQLRERVQVVMPVNGGRIVTTGTPSNPKYLVYDRTEQLRRTLIVDRRGKVMQELPHDDDDDDDDDERTSNSIKLGLVRN